MKLNEPKNPKRILPNENHLTTLNELCSLIESHPHQFAYWTLDILSHALHFLVYNRSYLLFIVQAPHYSDYKHAIIKYGVYALFCFCCLAASCSSR